MSFSDSIYGQIPNWDQALVREASVLVVGAGALGNEVLKNLALLNVQRIAILDLDHVEHSNLSRSVLYREMDAESKVPKVQAAASRLLELNPDLQLLAIQGDVAIDLPWGLLNQIDVVIGCLDNRLARLYLNRWCWRAGKPWVDGGILNLSGQVSVYVPGHSCYECGLGPQAWKEIRDRQGCTDMARRYALAGHAPTTPIAASIIGAMQVQEALKLVLGQQEQSLAGSTWTYEGAHLHAAAYTHKGLKSQCDSHWEAIVPEPAPLGAKSTLGDLWQWARGLDGLDEAELHLRLDHSVVTKIGKIGSGEVRPTVVALPRFSDRLASELGIDPGEGLAAVRGGMQAQVGPSDLPDDTSLCRLGLAPGQAFRLDAGATRQWFWLAGDAEALEFRPGVRSWVGWEW